MLTLLPLFSSLFSPTSFEEPCFEGRHLRYALILGGSQIFLYAIGLPLLVFVFLYRHRHELDKPVVKFRYGLFFAGFRKKKYYWECVVAIRKESTVILAVFGSQLGVAMLAHVALLVFMIQLLIQLVGHPYEPKQIKLQGMDVGSIVICWGTMWSGFFFYSPRPLSQKGALEVLTMLVVTINALFMLFMLFSMCTQVMHEHKDSTLVRVMTKKTMSMKQTMANVRMSPAQREALNKKRQKLLTQHLMNPSHFSQFDASEVAESAATTLSIEMKKMTGTRADAARKQRITWKKKKHLGMSSEHKLSASQLTRRQRMKALSEKRVSLVLTKINILLTEGGVDNFSPSRVQSNPLASVDSDIREVYVLSAATNDVAGPYTMEDVEYYFSNGDIESDALISIDESDWIPIGEYIAGETEETEDAPGEMIYSLGYDNEIIGPYTLDDVADWPEDCLVSVPESLEGELGTDWVEVGELLNSLQFQKTVHVEKTLGEQKKSFELPE